MSAAPAAAPSGVVTFLFTDVEGSTRRWEADPDGMRVALAAHDAALRKAIEAHGGWLFKHTGDGVCAAFASPKSAVDAAVAAQRELELPVRMGLATGEAQLREGDYFGAVLNRAARVMAAGTAVRSCWWIPRPACSAELISSIWGRDGCGICLEDAEKTLLERCSVFAGGFDLQSACAVAGFNADDFVVLDQLDALVRKSLLVVDRSSGRTRFSMLETIRQFGEEQLAASGAAEEVRAAHAHHFAEKEVDILALWDSPRQRDAYTWFATERANLRTAFRWAADHRNLDDAATIATYAALLGFCVENYEPVAWAEELIETARAVNHRRLVFLYAMAEQCWFVGRIEEALRYRGRAGGDARRPG